MPQIINFNFQNKYIKVILNHDISNKNTIEVYYDNIIIYGNLIYGNISQNQNINNNRNTNLTVYYKEAPYANYNNFMKKDFFKTDEEILISRQIDRCIRPFLISHTKQITLNITLIQNLNTSPVLPVILWSVFLLCYYSGIHDIKNIYANLLREKNGVLLVCLNNIGVIMMEGFFNKISIEDFLIYIKQIKIEQQIFHEIFDQIIMYNICVPEEQNLLLNKSNKSNKCIYEKRIDNRKFNEIRPIQIQLQPLTKYTSAIFQRGETKVLGVLKIFKSSYADISLQYKFHPYSVGEHGETFGNSRREKGHSSLIQNSFKYQYYNDFSYKIWTEVLCCNGSSSMASVCATSLCLYMTYGEELVSGISCGIINKKIIVDLKSNEDHISNCDMKLVSNKDKKINSIFMDTKRTITYIELEKLLKTAVQHNIVILKTMVSAVKDIGYNTILHIKKEKIIPLLEKDHLKEIQKVFQVNTQIFESGAIIIQGEHKKTFNLAVDIIKSYDSMINGKQITCIVKKKTVLENKNYIINLGILNYTIDKFTYECGDIIKAIINNTQNKIILTKIKKIII